MPQNTEYSRLQSSHRRMAGAHPLSGPEAIALGQVATAPLMLGSVHQFTTILHAVVSIACLTYFTCLQNRRRQTVHSAGDNPPALRMGRGRSSYHWLADPVFWALLVAIVWTVVQIIPLPTPILQILSPRTHALLEYSPATALPGGAPMALFSEADIPGALGRISVAWPDTLVQAIRLTGYLALYLVFAVGFSTTWSRRRLTLVLVTTGVAVVLIGALHWLSGAERYLLFYQAGQTTNPPLLRGTFVNSNHQAAFLGMCALVALGGAISRSSRRRLRIFLGAGFIICMTGMISMISRAAFVSVIVCGALLLLAVHRHRIGEGARGFRAFISHSGPFAGLFLFMTLLGSWIAISPMGEKWSNFLHQEAGRSKFELWREIAPPMLSAHWLTGTGNGALASIYRHYLTSPLNVEFPYLENLYLQSALEWGLPFTLMFLVAIGIACALGAARRMTVLRAAFMAAILFVAVQNGADFNLAFGGTAIPAIALLAAICVNRGRPHRSWRSSPVPSAAPPARVMSNKPLLVVTVVLLLKSATMLVVYANIDAPRAGEAAQRLSQGTDDAHGDLEERMRLIHRSLAHRPLDASLMRLGAAHLAAANPPRLAEALELTNRSLFFDPLSADGHLLAGTIMEGAGPRFRSQALSHYRRALAIDPLRAQSLLQTMDTGAMTYPELRALFPDSSSRALMQLGSHLSGQERHQDASLSYREAAELNPGGSVALQQATRAALLANEPQLMLQNAHQWVSRAPSDWRAHHSLAASHTRLGRFEDALEAADKAIRLNPHHLELHLHRLRILGRVDRPNDLHRALEQMEQLGKDKPRWQGEILLQRALIAKRSLQPAAAVSLLHQAHIMLPDRADIPLTMGGLHEEMGQTPQAVEAYRRAMALDPSRYGHLEERVDRLRGRGRP